ncbi:hypothetical protein RB653_006945 [Dictyostelium firmibasis]|uniref:Uncharacterized protein n=1 Tax=Dictyostelium firmibasis TaxID=79012 RepID=A0AAN7YQR1_9MYCE
MYQPRINNNYILYPTSPPLLSECCSVSYPPPPFLNCNSNNSSPIHSPKSFNNIHNFNFNNNIINNINQNINNLNSNINSSVGTPPSPIQIPIICTTTIVINQTSPIQQLPIQYPQIQLEKFNLSPNSNQFSDHFNNNISNQKKKHRLSWKEIKKDFNLKHEMEKEKKKWKKFEEKLKEEMVKDKIKMKKNEIKIKKELALEKWRKIEIKFKSFYSEAEWKSFETKYRDQLNPELLDTILDLIF